MHEWVGQSGHLKNFYCPKSLGTLWTVRSWKKFGNRKLQKTWLLTLFGPLAAILNFVQKCKQTAVSQKLSKIKKFSRYILHLMRCLNFWDNKNFWGAKCGPTSPATSVKKPWNLGPFCFKYLEKMKIVIGNKFFCFSLNFLPWPLKLQWKSVKNPRCSLNNFSK